MAAQKRVRGERPADRAKAMNEYMAHLTHPMKAEVAAVRAIILQASSKIHERVKWDAPVFYYRQDLATFDLKPTKNVHLIMLFSGETSIPDPDGLITVDHENRRQVSFHNLKEIAAKKPALIQFVRDFVERMDQRTSDRG